MLRTSIASSSELVPVVSVPRDNRSLVRDNALSVGSPDCKNAIIHGENSEVLAVLGHRLRRSVRCIYIDPPYNNKETYNHYTDTDTHDVWLRGTVDHVRQLAPLLSDSGSIWISIDDWQMHYLKVALDEVFGRKNSVTTVVWEQRKSRENRKVFSNNHEYILVYAKDINQFKKTRNLLPFSQDVLDRYKNPDNDPRGPWQSVSANVQAGHATKGRFYEVVAPSGRRHSPPHGRCWVYTKERMDNEIAANNIWFGKDGRSVPRLKKFLCDSRMGLTPHTIWTADEVGTTDQAKKELLRLFPDRPVFDTPKPESLVERIIEIASDEGDLVFDSYLGSGTTAAVAHRLRRGYIGIEMGENAVTHCAERLQRLIAAEVENDSFGSDQETICGFGFYRLP